MIDPSVLAKFGTVYEFNCQIRLIRQNDGSWFVSDRNGFRLLANGIFIGTPAISRLRDWIEDTSFTFEGAVQALALRPEVRGQLAPFLPAHILEPAS
jgi:hypothetical protein